jgi:hypothetical protein
MSIFMPQGMPNQLYPMTIPARHPYSGSPQMMWLDAFMREKVRHDRLEDAQKVEGTDEGTVGRGAAGGAISGAITGTKISPGWGTLIGAVAGGALGGAGSYAGERERQKQQRAGYSGANTYAQDTQGLIDAAGGLVTQMYGPGSDYAVGKDIARMANLNAEYLRDQGHQRLQAAAQQPMGVAGSQAGFNQAQAMAAQMAERAGLETQWSTPTKIEIGQLNEALRLIGNDDTLTPEMKEQSTRFVMQQLQSKRPGWVPKPKAPWPENQGVGMTWEHPDWPGHLLTRDSRGTVKLLIKPEKTTGDDDQGEYSWSKYKQAYDMAFREQKEKAKEGGATSVDMGKVSQRASEILDAHSQAPPPGVAAAAKMLENAYPRKAPKAFMPGVVVPPAQVLTDTRSQLQQRGAPTTVPAARPSGPLPGEPQQQGPPPGSPQAAVQEAQSVLSDIAERAGTDDPTKWSKALKDVAKPAAEQMVAALEAAFPDPTQIPPELREMLQSLFDAGIIEK